MTLRDIVTDLQSLGARLEVPIQETGRRGGAGPTDGKQFILDDVVATVPTLGDFVQRSPYAVIEGEDGYHLTRDGQIVMPVRFHRTPQFYDLTTRDGIPYRQIALLHSVDTLATTVFQKCVRWHRPGERCQFCAVEQSLDRRSTIALKTPAQLAEVCEAAVRLDGIRHFVMTTGTLNLQDKGIRYLAGCARAVKAVTSVNIQVQVEPPEDLDDLALLREAGVDSLGLHLESFDQAVRERVIPGKATIGVDRYFEAFRRAVQVFGRNQVSSYIIVGIGESPQSIVAGCRKLAEIGVYPFVVPLRPVAGTPLQDARAPEREVMVDIYTQVAAINREFGLSWRKSKAGCERCGACSALPAFEAQVAHSPAHIAYKIAETEEELRGYYAVRRSIFVEEQGMFEGSDGDEHDTDAVHIVAIDEETGRVVGAVRCYEEGEGRWYGGRLAVLDGYRHRAGSIGPRLVRRAEEAVQQRGCTQFLAHVQLQNVRFFQRLGWKPVGSSEIYCGQPHQLMEASLRSAN